MKFILPFFCFFTIFLFAVEENTLLLDKLKSSKKGDFIVYEEGKSIHLLALHDVNDQYVLFEEIVAPKQPLQKSWSDWAQKKAPGHTSWIMLEIDLRRLQITECFSFSRDCWLSPSASESMIHHLLTLTTTPVLQDNRKKIGQPPMEGPDLRKVWQPPITIGGKALPKAQTLVYSAKWPKDNSPLSEKEIELYFYDKTPHFLLPHWIEVKDESHSHFKLRSIDAGSNFTSLYDDIPRRLPEFTSTPKSTVDGLLFPLRIPLYYSSLHLFAVDTSVDTAPPIELPFQKIEREKEYCDLTVDIASASELLTKGHRYLFFLTVEKPLPACIDAPGKILWQ